ncbi:hypothetical protein M0R04_15670 [Candidatus Dojkabacteria bacterium]|jgi:hypothetical protein|nr:hypothetical protein [Candidatus Dojkabacteria bacterium]
MEDHSGFKLLGNISGANFNIETTGKILTGTFEDNMSGLLSNSTNVMFTRNLRPRSDNAYDLGLNSARYKTIYATEISGAVLTGSPTINEISGAVAAISGTGGGLSNLDGGTASSIYTGVTAIDGGTA